MATLTEGYIYFLESDAVRNQNWLTDPENIVVGNFTEGTDLCKLELPRRIVETFSTGIQVTDPGGGTSVQVNWEKTFSALLSEGIETSLSNSNTVVKFIMNDEHTTATVADYKAYYVVVKFGTNDYWKFTDETGAQQEYCKGVILGGMRTWVESSPSTVIIALNWRSVWD